MSSGNAEHDWGFAVLRVAVGARGRVEGALLLTDQWYEWAQNWPDDGALLARAEQGDPSRRVFRSSPGHGGSVQLHAFLPVLVGRDDLQLQHWEDWEPFAEEYDNLRVSPSLARDFVARIAALGNERTVTTLSWPAGSVRTNLVEPDPDLREAIDRRFRAETKARQEGAEDQRRRVAVDEQNLPSGRRDRIAGVLRTMQVPDTAADLLADVIDFADFRFEPRDFEVELRLEPNRRAVGWLSTDVASLSVANDFGVPKALRHAAWTTEFGGARFLHLPMTAVSNLRLLELGRIAESTRGASEMDPTADEVVSPSDVADQLARGFDGYERARRSERMLKVLSDLGDRWASDLGSLVESSIHALLAPVNPFGGYLEAPEGIIGLHAKYGKALHDLEEQRDVLVGQLLRHAAQEHFAVAASRVRWSDLVRRGVAREEPPPPDLEDY